MTRVLYHLLLNKINPAAHQDLLDDPSVKKLYVSAASKFRHGTVVPDIRLRDGYISDGWGRTDYTDPFIDNLPPNAIIVRSDHPNLDWLLLQTRDLPT